MSTGKSPHVLLSRSGYYYREIRRGRRVEHRLENKMALEEVFEDLAEDEDTDETGENE